MEQTDNSEFESWQNARDRDQSNAKSVLQIASDVQHGFQAPSETSARFVINDLEELHYEALKEQLDEYRAEGRLQSETFKYWDTFLQGVDSLL